MPKNLGTLQLPQGAYNGAVLTSDASGNASWGGSPVALPGIGARIANTAAQTLSTSGSVTVLTFGTTRYDTDTMASVANRLTIKTAGIYDIGGVVAWAANATGLRAIGVRMNGSTILAWQHQPAGSTVSRTNVKTQYQMAAGDYLELVGFQDSTAALATVAEAGADISGGAEFWAARIPGNNSILVGPQAPAIGARVFNSASQSIATSTVTALTFDSESFDTDTIHDTATNTSRLTCRTSGIYTISAAVEWAANATGQRQIGFRLNGTTFIALQEMNPASSGVTQQTIETIYQLNSGDYIELIVWQSSGGALLANANPGYSNFLMMARVPGAQGSALSVTSTLPTSPVDGQECYYLADATNGVIWHLKYRAASASAYKWEYVGGMDLTNEVATDETTASATFVALSTAQSITLPLGGDYEIEWGFNGYNATGSSNLQMGLSLNGATPASTETIQASTSGANLAVSFMRRRRITGRAANDTVAARFATSTGTAHFRDRWFTVLPGRVG